MGFSSYYYSAYSPDKKKAYQTIYNGLKSRKIFIWISSTISEEELNDIYNRVIFDNPRLFYVGNGYSYGLMPFVGWRVMPKYIYSEAEVAKLKVEIEKVINKIKTNARKYQGKLFLLEKYIHNSVIKSVTYKENEANEHNSAHTIVGPLIEHRAVCEGMAKTFKLLCDEVGIKCIVVLGYADQERGLASAGSNHAWNIVKLGDDCYHVDVTWDNLGKDFHPQIGYDYFNITTEDIMTDHRPEGRIPNCTKDGLNYYVMTDSYVKDYKDLVDKISAKHQEKVIRLKASRKGELYNKPEELQQLTNKAMRTVCQKYFIFSVYYVSVRKSQRTITIVIGNK